MRVGSLGRHYSVIADTAKGTSERLVGAVNVHSILCDSSDHAELVERLEATVEETHVDAIISLCREHHPRELGLGVWGLGFGVWGLDLVQI